MDNQGAGTEKVANCCECAPLATFNFPIWCQDLQAPRSLSGAVESSLCPAAKQTDLVTLCCHFSFQIVMFYPLDSLAGSWKSAGDALSQQGLVIGDVLEAPGQKQTCLDSFAGLRLKPPTRWPPGFELSDDRRLRCDLSDSLIAHIFYCLTKPCLSILSLFPQWTAIKADIPFRFSRLMFLSCWWHSRGERELGTDEIRWIFID